ncbi:MAG: hypothetical protein MUF69_04975 [Desulfobacterota bacterium]|jgi:hypothetical protein|nr:hypothetical protein [Thermodesulfobacteriota bacterium]
MSLRVQVILDESDALKFRIRALQESKSLSAWLREAGKKMLKMGEAAPLADEESLKRFFAGCREREEGEEPDWEDHKKTIQKGYRRGGRP